MNQEQNNLNQKNFNYNGMTNNQSLSSNINQDTNSRPMNFDPLTGQRINQTVMYNNFQTHNQLNGFENNNQNYNNIQYATFGNRLVAILRDFLYSWWILLVGFVLIFIVRLILQMNNIGNNLLDATFMMLQISGPILFILLGQPLYAMVGDVSKRHASKGKFKQNICVLDKNGNYLTFSQSFLRMVLKYITIAIPFVLLITIIMMCVTQKKQALHDLILGHVVVKNVDKINIASSQNQNNTLALFVALGIALLAFIGLFLSINYSLKNSNKLICKSNEGDITIIYSDSGISSYIAKGIIYDLDNQQEYAKKIGMNEYLREFSQWFENNTTGTCTIE